MSSETSTDRSTFRPWHFFVLGSLVAATAGVLLSPQGTPAAIVLLSCAIAAAALVGLGVLRTLWPLAADDPLPSAERRGLRARAALEREKALVLRSIKELEFDRAMGKVSEADFTEMAGRLRRRALGLLQSLDRDRSGYRDLIERELRSRLGQSEPPRAPARVEVPDDRPSRPPPATESPLDTPPAADAVARAACEWCDTSNEPDARFCKECGQPLRSA